MNLAPILNVGSGAWMIGVVEDHRARPLTKEEIDYVLAYIQELKEFKAKAFASQDQAQVGNRGCNTDAQRPAICNDQQHQVVASAAAGESGKPASRPEPNSAAAQAERLMQSAIGMRTTHWPCHCGVWVRVGHECPHCSKQGDENYE